MPENEVKLLITVDPTQAEGQINEVDKALREVVATSARAKRAHEQYVKSIKRAEKAEERAAASVERANKAKDRLNRATEKAAKAKAGDARATEQVRRAQEQYNKAQERAAAAQDRARKARERENRALERSAKAQDKARRAAEKHASVLKQQSGATDKAAKSTNDFVSELTAAAVAVAGTAYALTALVKQTGEFQRGLIGVGKTTDLTGTNLHSLGEELRQVAIATGDTTKDLLDTARVAGQLGVQGEKNIAIFTETILKLGRASDLIGEEGATALARILNVSGEAIASVDTLASVIVKLGNNMAATEREIAHVTNEIARATAIYGVTSAQAAAFGATVAATGGHAEASRTAFARLFSTVQETITTGGAELEAFVGTLGLTEDAFVKTFQDSAFNSVVAVIQALGELDSLQQTAFFNRFNLEGERIKANILPLAENFQLFAQAVYLAYGEVENATELEREFARTLEGSLTQIDRSKQGAASLAQIIGRPLNASVYDIAKAFADWTAEAVKNEKALEDVGKAIQYVVVPLTAAVGTMVAVGIAMKGITLAGGFMGASFGAISTGVGKLSLALGPAGVTIAALTVGIGLLVTAFGDWGKAIDDMKAVFAGLKIAMSDLLDNMGSVGKAIREGVQRRREEIMVLEEQKAALQVQNEERRKSVPFVENTVKAVVGYISKTYEAAQADVAHNAVLEEKAERYKDIIHFADEVIKKQDEADKLEAFIDDIVGGRGGGKEQFGVVRSRGEVELSALATAEGVAFNKATPEVQKYIDTINNLYAAYSTINEVTGERALSLERMTRGEQDATRELLNSKVAISDLTPEVEALLDATFPLERKVIPGLRDELKAMAKYTGDNEERMMEFLGVVRHLAPTMTEAGVTMDNVKGILEDVAETFGLTKDQVMALQEAWEEAANAESVTKALEDQKKAHDELVESIERTILAIDKEAASTKRVLDQIALLDKGYKLGIIPTYKEYIRLKNLATGATQRLEKALADEAKEIKRSQTEAQRLLDRLFPLEKAKRENGEAIDILTEAYKRGEIDAIQLTEAIRILNEELDRTKDKAKDAAEEVNFSFKKLFDDLTERLKNAKFTISIESVISAVDQTADNLGISSKKGSKIGSTVGGLGGSVLGYLFGGPLGALIGNKIGSAIGKSIGNLIGGIGKVFGIFGGGTPDIRAQPTTEAVGFTDRKRDFTIVVESAFGRTKFSTHDDLLKGMSDAQEQELADVFRGLAEFEDALAAQLDPATIERAAASVAQQERYKKNKTFDVTPFLKERYERIFAEVDSNVATSAVEVFRGLAAGVSGEDFLTQLPAISEATLAVAQAEGPLRDYFDSLIQGTMEAGRAVGQLTAQQEQWAQSMVLSTGITIEAAREQVASFNATAQATKGLSLDQIQLGVTFDNLNTVMAELGFGALEWTDANLKMVQGLLEAENGIESFINELVTLRDGAQSIIDRFDPLGAAMRKNAADQVLIQAAFDRGAISLEQYELAMGGLQTELESLTAGTEALGAAAGRTAEQLAQSAQAIIDRYDPVGARIRKLNDDLATLSKAYDAGTISLEAYDNAVANVNADIAAAEAGFNSASAAISQTTRSLDGLKNQAGRLLGSLGLGPGNNLDAAIREQRRLLDDQNRAAQRHYETQLRLYERARSILLEVEDLGGIGFDPRPPVQILEERGARLQSLASEIQRTGNLDTVDRFIKLAESSKELARDTYASGPGFQEFHTLANELYQNAVKPVLEGIRAPVRPTERTTNRILDELLAEQKRAHIEQRKRDEVALINTATEFARLSGITVRDAFKQLGFDSQSLTQLLTDATKLGYESVLAAFAGPLFASGGAGTDAGLAPDEQPLVPDQTLTGEMTDATTGMDGAVPGLTDTGGGAVVAQHVQPFEQRNTDQLADANAKLAEIAADTSHVRQQSFQSLEQKIVALNERVDMMMQLMTDISDERAAESNAEIAADRRNTDQIVAGLSSIRAASRRVSNQWGINIPQQ